MLFQIIKERVGFEKFVDGVNHVLGDGEDNRIVMLVVSGGHLEVFGPELVGADIGGHTSDPSRTVDCRSKKLVSAFGQMRVLEFVLAGFMDDRIDAV